jgi:hypothetical protein
MSAWKNSLPVCRVSEVPGQVALRVKVDQQHAGASQRYVPANVSCGGRFADSAFAVR